MFIKNNLAAIILRESPPKKMTLHKLDREIIFELQKDGRASFSKLSKNLGISNSTIRRRVESLLKNGVITITAIPDPVKVGYNVVVVIGISADLKNIEPVIRQLSKDPCNHLIAATTGRYDIVSWSLFSSSQELTEYLTKRLARIKGITKAETLLSLDTKKRTFGWIRK